ACSFPFGIWTARRELACVEPLTVWPKVYPITGSCSLVGGAASEHNEGQRSGRTGDFVGVRAFRRGDSPRHIHWTQSARTGTLIVTERGAPQCAAIELLVDTTGCGSSPSYSSRMSLANRIRIAASILCNLHAGRFPMQVMLGHTSVPLICGPQGRRQILDALADVPIDGTDQEAAQRRNCKGTRIEIAPAEHEHAVRVTILSPNGGKRAGGLQRTLTLRTDQPLAAQLKPLWQEVEGAVNAA
ncbi:MAG: DUF58 domain-containing protein, partial [Pirellulales bacterium]|nr:DUF58 domain-containing protein [Pirellulales bacterium]